MSGRRADLPAGAALATLYRYEGSHWWARGMLACTQAILQSAGWHGQGDLLDVGCGSGGTLADLPARQRVGLDINRLALAYARQYPHLDLVLGSAMDLPFRPGRFDLVVALDSLDQWGVNMALALAACAAQLAPGGSLLLRVSAYPWLTTAYDRAAGTASRSRRRDLVELVAGAGLAIRRLTYANSLLLPLAVLRRLQGRYFSATPVHDLRPPLAPLNALLLSVLRGEARWLRRHDFAWGLSLYCLAGRLHDRPGTPEPEEDVTA